MRARDRGIERTEAAIATAIAVFTSAVWLCQVCMADQLLVVDTVAFAHWLANLSTVNWCGERALNTC